MNGSVPSGTLSHERDRTVYCIPPHDKGTTANRLTSVLCRDRNCEHGGSSHAWIQVADIPCLRHRATSCGFGELDGTIVIDLGDREWAFKERVSMFTLRVLLDHHSIPNGIDVFFTRGVLSFVVLEDKRLLSLLDVFLVGLEADVEKSVTTKHKL